MIDPEWFDDDRGVPGDSRGEADLVMSILKQDEERAGNQSWCLSNDCVSKIKELHYPTNLSSNSPFA